MAHRIKTLLENAKFFLENADIHLILPEILDKIIADTDAERAQILFYNDANEIVLKKGRDKGGNDLVDDEDNRISRRVLELALGSHEPILSSDAMNDPLFAEPERELTTVERQKLLSVVCAPLRSGDGSFGVLYIDNRQVPARFNQETGRQVYELAGLLGESLKKSFELTLKKQQEHERQEQHVRTLRAALDRLLGHEEILGNCPAIVKVRQALEIMKDFDFPVLILGETGTGKELVAKALHRTGPRHHKPFVTFDCCAVPENMLESELFGYERGAFTGADRTKPGIIDQAEGGTLFLDEIGNLSLEVQKKLLRFLETKTYYRLGNPKEQKVELRLIFATNKDLPALVLEKKFLPDLHYRLTKGRTIALPPLRDRGEDILLLAEALLNRYNQEYKTHARFTTESHAQLLAYSYPGNVRELESMVSTAVWEAKCARSEVIEPQHLHHSQSAESAPAANDPLTRSVAGGDELYARYLPEENRNRRLISGQCAPSPENARAAQIARQHDLHDQLLITVSEAVGIPFKAARAAVVSAFERNLLAALLMTTQRTQKDAIKLAQIDDKTFIKKMKEHGLRWEWFVE